MSKGAGDEAIGASLDAESSGHRILSLGDETPCRQYDDDGMRELLIRSV